jgi:hypothetical protein
MAQRQQFLRAVTSRNKDNASRFSDISECWWDGGVLSPILATGNPSVSARSMLRRQSLTLRLYSLEILESNTEAEFSGNYHLQDNARGEMIGDLHEGCGDMGANLHIPSAFSTAAAAANTVSSS